MPPKYKLDTEVHECIFMAKITEVQMMFRFPCRLSVSWKDNFNHEITKTKNDNATLVNNVAVFNEKIGFKTHLLF